MNKITKADKYPLPLITETLRVLANSKWLTKLDIIQAFHKIRIAKGEEWKTAFRTRYGLFEWTVTPFGLNGAPATFQRYMNSIFNDLLDVRVSIYMDDIVVYSNGTEADHMQKVRTVLDRLMEHGLHADPDKCVFKAKQIKYLGFIVNSGLGIQADPERVKAILEWEAPTTVSGVRGFLGFVNFYRMFIPNFSDACGPLTALTRNNELFVWGEDQEEVFLSLKSLFTKAPILREWDETKRAFLNTDSSGFALGGVLNILDKDGMKPVAFHSKKLLPDLRRKSSVGCVRGKIFVECLNCRYLPMVFLTCSLTWL